MEKNVIVREWYCACLQVTWASFWTPSLTAWNQGMQSVQRARQMPTCQPAAMRATMRVYVGEVRAGKEGGQI